MSVFSSLHHHIDKPEKVFSSRQDQQCQYFTTKNGVVSPNFLVPKAFAQFQENRPKLCKKMCLSPNFPHQQIRGNYGIFPVLGGEVKMKQECCFYRLPSNLKKKRLTEKERVLKGFNTSLRSLHSISLDKDYFAKSLESLHNI